MQQLTHAFDFVARRHATQRRKGGAAEPYVNHLAEVAHLLAQSGAGDDAELVVAGLLHDSLEDTPTTFEELAALFGPGVAALVAEVTDDKSLPKAERKRLQIAKTPTKTLRARLIKLADKTSNLRSLATSPPADWDRARMAGYLDWAEQVVVSCRGLDPFLERAFDAAATDLRLSLDT